jgi:hypothetical protein
MGIPEGKTQLGRLGRRRKTILKWTLKKRDGMEWNSNIWLRIRTGEKTITSRELLE